MSVKAHVDDSVYAYLDRHPATGRYRHDFSLIHALAKCMFRLDHEDELLLFNDVEIAKEEESTLPIEIDFEGTLIIRLKPGALDRLAEQQWVCERCGNLAFGTSDKEEVAEEDRNRCTAPRSTRSKKACGGQLVLKYPPVSSPTAENPPAPRPAGQR